MGLRQGYLAPVHVPPRTMDADETGQKPRCAMHDMEEQSPIEHRRSTRLILYVYDVVRSDLTRAMAPMQSGSAPRRPMKPRKADLPRPVASACARVRETCPLRRAEPHCARVRHGGVRHIVFYRAIAIARHMNDTLPSGAHFGGTRCACAERVESSGVRNPRCCGQQAQYDASYIPQM